MCKVTLEVCVDSLESAVAAVQGGAHRLEVCGNLPLYGGTTPSQGLVKLIQKTFPSVPLMVMIRPRVGDFVYSDQEFETMLEDVGVFNALGVYGVVFGMLTPHGLVDGERCRRFVAASLPMQVTFHRAFDLTADHKQALEDIASVPGITRILTSGHATPRAYEPVSLERLNALAGATLALSRGNSPLRIVPGSGINPHTIGRVFSALGNKVDEYHMSGGSWVDGIRTQVEEQAGKVEDFQMGPRGLESAVWKTDAAQVRGVLQALGVQCENRV